MTSHARSVALVLIGLLLLLASAVDAKPPTRKQIDAELLKLGQEAMAPIKAAEDALHAANRLVEQIGTELSNARLDQAAAKAWVDASTAVGRALEADDKAANAALRHAEHEELASRIVRANSTGEWRDARFAAAKLAVSLQLARQSWGKADVGRLELELEQIRLETYTGLIAADIEASNEARAEAGRVQVKAAKQAMAANKERSKMEDAEREHNDATARAAALDPSR